MNIFSFWKTEVYNKQYDQGCNKHLVSFNFSSKSFQSSSLDHFQLQIIEIYLKMFKSHAFLKKQETPNMKQHLAAEVHLNIQFQFLLNPL